jgi:hypothetical protein
MLIITRDGAKIIDKKMKFKEDLLSRRKQEKLIFKYLFRFDPWYLNFLVVFLILCIPTSFAYYSILTSNGETGSKIVLCFFMFIMHIVITGMFVTNDCASCENTVYKLSKRVLTRLEQLDSSIIDTTLEERTKIAEWFIEEDRLVGIRKDSNDSYTLFYRNSGNIDEERIYLCIHKIPITTEISNQMIKGYAYSISDLLTYNAPSNEK